MKEVRFSTLTPEWQHLIRIMQRLGHGRLEHLNIVNGNPQDDMQLTTVAEYRFPGLNGCCDGLNLEDFALKRDLVQFIDEVREIKDVTIEVVHVKYGLPYRMEVKSRV